MKFSKIIQLLKIIFAFEIVCKTYEFIHFSFDFFNFWFHVQNWESKKPSKQMKSLGICIIQKTQNKLMTEI